MTLHAWFVSPAWLQAVVVLLLSGQAAAAEPHTLATGQGADAPKQPQAHLSADGTVDLVFAVGNQIQLATSFDEGQTLVLAPTRIPCTNLAAGHRRGPRVVRVGQNVVVTAITGEQGKGKDGDLFAWVTTDNGATWNEPVPVNDHPASAREGLHAMTATASGDVWCCWLDLRADTSQVYAARSTDGGLTWQANRLAYQSPDGSVCPCCHPSIAEAAGSVQILFRNALAGNRDMFLADCTDGQTFAQARKLGRGSWPLDLCPMDGGMLAGSADELMTVWRRENQVFATWAADQPEVLLGEGKHPWAAWSKDGPVVVWQGKNDQLWQCRGAKAKPLMLDATGAFPVVAGHADVGFVIAAWDQKQGDKNAVVWQTYQTGITRRGNR